MTDDISMKLESLDVTAGRIEELRGLFPEVFTEEKIDFEKLRLALGDRIEVGKNATDLPGWQSRGDASRQVPSTATLVPAPEESVEWETTQNVFIEVRTWRCSSSCRRAISPG